MPAPPVNPPSPAPSADEDLMTFGEHLEELRKRMILGLVGVGVALMVTLFFGKAIVWWLHQPLISAMRDLGLPARTIGTSVLSGFSVYFKVSLIAGVIVALPWIIYQVWRFISSGLYDHEQRAVRIVIPFSTTMAVLGVSFAYYIMLPFTLRFLIGFTIGMPMADLMPTWSSLSPTPQAISDMESASPPTRLPDPGPGPSTSPPTREALAAYPEGGGPAMPMRIPLLQADPPLPTEGEVWVNRRTHELKVFFQGGLYSVQLQSPSIMTPMIEAEKYINFMAVVILGCALAFQLPPIMLVGGWAGVIDPDFLAAYRRHAMIVCLLLGAVFTPADPGSMFLLAVPIYVLFEFGLVLVRLTRSRPDDATTA